MFDLSYSKRVKSDFLLNKVYVKYEKNIEGLDSSILQIPVLSGIITVAWAIGADVYTEELDETYLESLCRIRQVMAHWHPDFSCSTEINARNIVSNRFRNHKFGLLFTGGVDSIASYIKHRLKKPALIKIWGQDVCHDDETTWKNVRKILTEFSDNEHLKLHEIRTNIPQVFNEQALYRKFGLNWWPHVCHSIVLTGLCAPLTCAEDIGTLLIGASNTPEFRYPWGSDPRIDNNISWASTKVIHDNYDLDRQLKIRYFLKDYLRNNSYVFLKVCNNVLFPTSNCGKCEKCLRTITGLVSEGIDPNRCGFNNVNRKTFDHIRKSFDEKDFLISKWIVERRGDFIERLSETFEWENIQKHLPKTIENDLCGSKEFFEWFKSLNLSEYLQHTQRKISLPYFLYMCTMAIHRHSPRRIQDTMKKFLDFSINLYNNINH